MLSGLPMGARRFDCLLESDFYCGDRMMAWELLLGSDVGLMSLAVIVGVLVIGVAMSKMYARKIEEESGQHK